MLRAGRDMSLPGDSSAVLFWVYITTPNKKAGHDQKGTT